MAKRGLALDGLKPEPIPEPEPVQHHDHVSTAYEYSTAVVECVGSAGFPVVGHISSVVGRAAGFPGVWVGRYVVGAIGSRQCRARTQEEEAAEMVEVRRAISLVPLVPEPDNTYVTYKDIGRLSIQVDASALVASLATSNTLIQRLVREACEREAEEVYRRMMYGY